MYISLLVGPVSIVSAQQTVTVFCEGFSPWSDAQVACSVNSTDSTSSSSSQAWYDSEVLETSGWWNLNVKSSTYDNSAASLRSAAYAAGVAEGILSCNEITQFSYNVLTSSFGRDSGPNDQVLEFVNDNDAWVASQVAEFGETDDYWLAVSQITSTMDGILEGYNVHSVCASQPDFVPMTYLDLLLVNLDGDLFDIMAAYPDSRSAQSGVVDALKGLRHRSNPSSTKELRCSSLFKMTDNDVFFGHDTWDTYATAAPRIFKHITLPVRRGDEVVPYTNSFSSSPGFVASIDDYYLLSGSSRLTVIETSNEVYNTSVYSLLTPETNMCWVRTMVANMLATNGSDWSSLFGEYHSGTYNNQWMVLDANKYSGDMKDLFWVLEEAPGLIHAEDMTSTLVDQGYWASYNVAYFDDIRAQMGETQSYTNCPRANLFREFEGSVVDEPSMKKVMGWNDYENDAYSLGKPSNAIMARDDLMGFAAGGIDAKCSSLSVSRGDTSDPLVTHTRAGPTHDSLPPFCWGTKQAFDITPHKGHPNCFAYDWADVQPAI